MKNKYVEVGKGVWEDGTYREQVILVDDLPLKIRQGWNQTSWSKRNPELVPVKWENAIKGMEEC